MSQHPFSIGVLPAFLWLLPIAALADESPSPDQVEEEDPPSDDDGFQEVTEPESGKSVDDDPEESPEEEDPPSDDDGDNGFVEISISGNNTQSLFDPVTHEATIMLDVPGASKGGPAAFALGYSAWLSQQPGLAAWRFEIRDSAEFVPKGRSIQMGYNGISQGFIEIGAKAIFVAFSQDLSSIELPIDLSSCELLLGAVAGPSIGIGSHGNSINYAAFEQGLMARLKTPSGVTVTMEPLAREAYYSNRQGAFDIDLYLRMAAGYNF